MNRKAIEDTLTLYLPHLTEISELNHYINLGGFHNRQWYIVGIGHPKTYHCWLSAEHTKPSFDWELAPNSGATIAEALSFTLFEAWHDHPIAGKILSTWFTHLQKGEVMSIEFNEYQRTLNRFKQLELQFGPYHPDIVKVRTQLAAVASQLGLNQQISVSQQSRMAQTAMIRRNNSTRRMVP